MKYILRGKDLTMFFQQLCDFLSWFYRSDSPQDHECFTITDYSMSIIFNFLHQVWFDLIYVGIICQVNTIKSLTRFLFVKIFGRSVGECHEYMFESKKSISHRDFHIHASHCI